VPLRLNGKLIGAVTVWRDQPEPPLTTDDQLALQWLADRAALAIVNAQLYTDLQQALQTEHDTRQQLVQAETFAALGRIVAAVAHELNNPLQTIRNCLFLIQQEIRPDELMHEYFQMAAAEFERLTNLVAQLRALQRSRVTTVMQPLDLRALIDGVHVLLEAKLTAHQIRWQSSIETSHCTIVGTPDQLKQVCLNIGLNALEAMQARGGALSVDLIASDSGEQVGVRFRDKGPGIEPENLVKVFEPLFTTKPNGLGLGLPICYEIVQRHNGRITVESEPGHGATFTVWLPLADQA
jgi:signal transduction histidine kinase